MRLRRRLIWIPLALAGAIIALSAPLQAQIMYDYHYGPSPYYYGPGIGDGPGSCYEDSLRGRVCRD